MVTIRMTAAVALIFTLALAAGCSKQQGGEGKKPSGQVLAEVNGEKITVDDFKKEINNLPPYLQPMTETPEGKRDLLDTMIVRELILQEAKKAGVEKLQGVQDKIEDMRKRVIVETYLKQKVESDAAISDNELKAFYEQNKDKFKSGEEVRASHILVKSEPEAQKVLAELKAGKTFEALAKQYSVDTNAGSRGGDLGWFGKGAMLPDFEKVAFSLKDGETSGIVKTKFGYHIIRVTGHRPPGARSFDEVKDQIKAAMIPSKQQEVFAKLKADLKKSAKFSIKEDVMKGIGGATGAASAGPAQPAPAPQAAPAGAAAPTAPAPQAPPAK